MGFNDTGRSGKWNSTRRLLAVLGVGAGFAGGSASADFVQVDFNDPPMVPGTLAGQAGEAGLAGNYGGGTSPELVAGDLSYAGAGYSLAQSGTGLSASSPDGVGFSQANSFIDFATPLSGEIWFSFLVQNGSSGSRTGISLNRTFTSPAAPRFMTLGSQLFVGLPSDADTRISDQFATDGATTNLVLGRINLDTDGSSDQVRLWVDPTLDGGVGGLGAPVFDSFVTGGPANEFGSAINQFGVISYGTVAGRVDNVAFSDTLTGFSDVTGQAPPVIADWNVDADGLWTSGDNWTPAIAPDDAGAVAILGDIITAPRTLTLDSGISLSILSIDNEKAYTIAGGGSLAVAEIDVTQGTHTIAVELDGTNGLNKTGAGSLVVSGNNTYTGVTTLTGGQLRAQSNTALGSAADGTEITGGQLVLDGGHTIGDDLALAGRPSVSAAAHVVSDTGINTLAGDLTASSAGSVILESSAGSTLNIPGTVNSTGLNAATTLVLRGEGDGEISGAFSEAELLDERIALVKRGGGTWTISTGSSSAEDFFTGTTTIEQGRLEVLASAGDKTVGELGAGDIRVNAGATFDVDDFTTYSLQVGQDLSGAGAVEATQIRVFDDNSIRPGDDGPGTLTVAGNLDFQSFSASPTGSLVFELSDTTTIGGGVNDLIDVTGDVTASGAAGNKILIDILPVGSSLASGTYRLIQVGGNLADPSVFELSDIGESRVTAELATASGNVDLDITGSNANLVWTGANGSDWDLNDTQNFTNNGSPDTFFNLDTVVFDDTASVFDVNVSETVLPGAVTFNNSANDFSLGGQPIAGGGGLTKNGSGTLTLTSNNSYAGVTRINDGVVLLRANQDDPSVAARTSGPLGSTAGITVVNGGTLDITGENVGFEALHLAGDGADGRGALITDGLNNIFGNANLEQLKVIELDADASIGMHVPEADVPLGEPVAGDSFRVDLRPGASDPAPVRFDGNGHVLTKKGRGTFSIVEAGDMNVGGVVIEQGTLLIQGSTTFDGPATVGTGEVLGEPGTGRPTLSFFSNTAVSAPPVQDMAVILNGGVLSDGSSVDQEIAGPITVNAVGAPNTDGVYDGVIAGSSSAATVISGAIGGDGGVLFGGGTLELRSPSTYAGNTGIEGSVTLAGDATLGSGPRIEISEGGSLDVTGTTSGVLALDSKVLLIGGTVVGDVTAANAAEVRIEGGSVNGGLTAGDSAVAASGAVTGDFVADAGATLTVGEDGVGRQLVTRELGAAQDVRLRYSPINATGDANEGATSNLFLGPISATDNTRILMEFDLSSIPMTAITDLALTLSAGGTDPSSADGVVSTIEVRELDVAFVDAEATGEFARAGVKWTGVPDDPDGWGGDLDFGDQLSSTQDIADTFGGTGSQELVFDSTPAFEAAIADAIAGGEPLRLVANVVGSEGASQRQLFRINQSETGDGPTLSFSFEQLLDIGEFAVGGDFTHNTGATTALDIAGLDALDQVLITGDTNLNGGTLEIRLIDGFTPSEGDVFDLFDFGGAVSGGFDSLVLPDLVGLTWDTSSLLTTGELAVVAGGLIGDLNGDGFVGAGDLDILLGVWNQSGVGLVADLNGDDFIGAGDLDILLGNWNAGTPPTVSAVPEPATAALLALGVLGALTRRRA